MCNGRDAWNVEDLRGDSVLTELRLGGNFSGGYLRRVTFIPRRVTNAQLQALSA